MSYAVKIKPSNYVIFVDEGESVLDAAIRQGYDFPYSCRSATCATCMGKVIKGSVNYGSIEPYALDEADQDEGFALFCSAIPESDLIIEMEDVYGPEYRPAKTAEYKVVEHNHVTDDIHHLVLAPTTEKVVQYTAGQYLNVVFEDGVQMSFTIANAPQANQQLSLYIRHVADNPFTTKLLEHTKAGNNLTIKAPYGKVVYRKEPTLPIIFIAGGTGVVLAKAIIDAMLEEKNPQPTTLYWGVSKAEDLFLNDYFEKLAQQHNWLAYKPIVGKKVHEVILSEHPDLSGFQVYASGPSDMVFAASKGFQEHGLKPHWFYSDALEQIGD